MDSADTRPASRRIVWLALLFGVPAIAVLLALGTWQVQRLQWKEALVATIAQRIDAAPLPLAAIEEKAAEGAALDYWPVVAKGRFLHEGERHFLATHQGKSGFFVYTPMLLDDARIVFVNRGFVPYDLKDAARRPAGQVEGEVAVTGLARDRLSEKPSSLVPDNDPAKNVFYWKDLDAMAASAGLPAGADVLPFFIDANDAPNPGGWPAGGVTIIELPNNHLQYAVTWYGLAAALAGVMLVGWLKRTR
jgi:surfeit locus 1 family protein